MALCLPFVACFEEPVSERVHLTIRNDGMVVMTIVHEVAPTGRWLTNVALIDRLAEARDTIGRSLDPWSTRLASQEPLAETVRFERDHGELVRSMRSVVLPFEQAVQVLEGDGLTGSFDRDMERYALRLYSTGGSRASAVQQQLLEQQMSVWSVEVAAYLRTLIDLYRHFDTYPDRAVPCLASLFDLWDVEDGLPPLDRLEVDLVGAAKSAMEGVAEALLVPDDGAYSLNELSRLVHDPFPARLTLEVSGEVLGVDGLSPSASTFERPRIDAWTALRSLAGRWAAPDIITATVAPVSEEELPEPDPVAFASRVRRYTSAPTAVEVRSELELQLTAADRLALDWRPTNRPLATDEFEPDWLAVIAAAETSLPD
jgi:hypothetical protein